MISIALASYNGSKYIREQLDSILMQTYQDFELIICDDCSTDNTWQILEEYAQKDCRIKIFKNENNLGFKKNFEKAISLCNGEYIATSDQDDIWDKEHLGLLKEIIKNDVAAAGEALLVNENGKSLNRFMTKDVSGYEIDVDSVRKLSHLLFCSNPFSGAVSMFKKEVFYVALPVPEECSFQDTWFTACALCMGNLNFTQRVVTFHRLHGDNQSGAQKSSFWNKLKNTFLKDFYTDRIDYCIRLEQRFPNLSLDKANAIAFGNEYLTARKNKKKIKAIKMLINNYSNMFASDSKWKLFLRCMQILVRN